MNVKVTTTHGFDWVDVLLIVFVVLKLCGAVDWGWATVLAPLWFILGEVYAAVWVVWKISKKEAENDSANL